MNQTEQREYWRIKQRESRARRRAKKNGQPLPRVVAPPKVSAPRFNPAPAYGINANVSCRASMEEIAALGPAGCIAFMNGVASVISVLASR